MDRNKYCVNKMIDYIKTVKAGNKFTFTITLDNGSKSYVSGKLVKKFPFKRYSLRLTSDYFKINKKSASKKEVAIVLTDFINIITCGDKYKIK